MLTVEINLNCDFVNLHALSIYSFLCVQRVLCTVYCVLHCDAVCLLQLYNIDNTAMQRVNDAIYYIVLCSCVDQVLTSENNKYYII